MSSRKRIVVADAGVLINLIHVNALQLFGRLAGFEFVVIEHVVQEIIRPDQAAALAHAMQQGWIDEKVWTVRTASSYSLTSCGSLIEGRPQVWLGPS